MIYGVINSVIIYFIFVIYKLRVVRIYKYNKMFFPSLRYHIVGYNIENIDQQVGSYNLVGTKIEF